MQKIQEEINKELKNYFKEPPLNPFEVEVSFDELSKMPKTKMWIAYNEKFESDDQKGYSVAYEPSLRVWHVIEQVNDHYIHVCEGGNIFQDAMYAM